MKLCISKDEATFIQKCIAFKKDVDVESKAVGESLIYRINKLLIKKGVKRT